MTVLIAKVISRVSVPFYGGGTVSFPRFLAPSIFPRLAIKKEFLTAAFTLFTVLAALIYVIEMNVIIFEGRRLPALETALKDLQQEQKVKFASLAILRSPAAIKKEAVYGNKMIEVKDMRYLNSTESVAVNTKVMP
ncbi:MAG: hypothetical protein Q7R91_00875 [bacterium]|nr:hypothetical protein [bacterium]